MNPSRRLSNAWIAVLSPALVWIGGFSARAADPPTRVIAIKTPDAGIQPQAVTDAAGVIHLLYFRGQPSGGDLYHARREPGETEFSGHVRVNSQPGSAVAVGTIRGGQLAIGKEGRVHVAWNGSSRAEPPNPILGSPMLYSRSNPEGTAFEPQRNLMRRTFHLDGGGSVAADAQGRVYVAWHAASAEGPEGEAGRRLWVARSEDDGATFTEEKPALEQATGACACCGTKALVDRRGTLHVLFRAATASVERDMTLVTSTDHGETFQAASLQPWPVTTCPMSSESLLETPQGVLAAWETKGRIAYSRIDPQTLVPSKPISPPGTGNRKHPALAVNASGEILVAWTEDTGWQRGGALVWRIFSPSGQATREMGRIEGGIPVWGLPAAAALPDGRFLIIH
ncbi:MAG: sialidase family protein [Isosphaeraceae bacterium]